MKSSRDDFAFGVDVGGTNIRVAAVSRRGRILTEKRIATQVEHGREAVFRRLCNLILEMQSHLDGGHRHCVGVGVGVPGLIYYHRELHDSPNFPGPGKFPVKSKMERQLPFGVWVDNDANVAALGEVWRGAARGLQNICLLTLGTGVGCGLVLEGKIWSGTRGTAAECGHMVVDPEGERCNCGTVGCVETIASATWVVRRARAAAERGESFRLKKLFDKKEEVTSFDIARTAEQGDPAARKVFERVGGALGIAIANLMGTLDLEKFIIAGGAANAWPLFAPSLLEEVHRRSYVYRAHKVPIVRSLLIDKAGLLGAARMVWQAAKD